MVHAIRMLKCKNGHTLPIGYDSNECGCCHDGKPYLVINCRECFETAMKETFDGKDVDTLNTIHIPLDEEGVKIINELKGGLQ